MRVLVACEFSGIVRDAFVRAGHDAMSCDLLPSETERPDGWDGHYQGDILELLADKSYQWDIMIHHAPCTYSTLAGVRWLYRGGRGTVRDAARWDAMERGARFFRALQDADIPRICGENPIPHSYARAIMGDYQQIIQPWQFGHGESKATCLWLKNLPELVPTNIVAGRTGRVHWESPGPNRWKNRSRTYTGIAQAMAEQWGNLPPTK